MFVQRRKNHQLQPSRKCLLYLCLIALIVILIYLLFTKQYLLIFQFIQIPLSTLQSSATRISSISNRIRKGNNHSRIDLKFQPSIPSYYPYLPIHIFTQNLSSLTNESKLILLGNGFFGSENWGLNVIGNSSAELMTQLSCPFLSNYCDITTDKNLFSQADAVVYHIRDDINLKQARKFRHPDQRFVFALWESPRYTPDLKPFKGFFNWTMTYRFQSHIIASYYFGNSYIHTSNNYYHLMIKENLTKNLNLRLEKFDHQLSDNILAEKKLGTVAALISNCDGGSHRLKFIKVLGQYIDIKIYGRCGEKCPDNIDCQEFLAKNYYFFLSFENSLCTDYTSKYQKFHLKKSFGFSLAEKFFATLQLPVVPVVYGRTNYSYFIPSSGFIDTNDFNNPTSLAQYLNQTRYNKEKYLSYFLWKENFVWGLTHLFTAFCDLCLRLHLDSTPNVIEDIDAWWNNNACDKPRKF